MTPINTNKKCIYNEVVLLSTLEELPQWDDHIKYLQELHNEVTIFSTKKNFHSEMTPFHTYKNHPNEVALLSI